MLRMVPSRSSQGAKAYFESGLSHSDGLNQANYYINGQELPGQIYGRLAARIGMSGSITKEQFFDLVDNINPVTKQQLTPHTKENRTVGYDICFNIPKSVSIIHALSEDTDIRQIFVDSVKATMAEIEADILTRVRKDGKNEERHSGELIYSMFVHETARPTPGAVADPLLHAHCYCFNACWDPIEQKIKAGQFREINRRIILHQARFHKTFSNALIHLGYNIKATKSGSYEIAGVPEEAIQLFSKRKIQIERVAAEKGIKNVNELGQLGARTRSEKNKDLSMAELKADWRRQLRELELSGKMTSNDPVRYAPKQKTKEISAKDCISYSIAHNLERASVVSENKLLADACLRAIGHRDVSLDAITEAYESNTDLIKVLEGGNRKMVTTKTVLAEERKMVALARKDQGKLRPLYFDTPFKSVDGEHQNALNHVLTTTNRVSIIMGAAGSGKTTLIKTCRTWIENAGKQLFTVAPTAEASRGVLRSEGFEDAETLAKLLTDTKMQEAIKNQALFLDEAGLVPTRDMIQILELCINNNVRLILGGDTRQFSSILRGDALRILNTVAGIKAAEVTKIYRQQNEDYRNIVEDLAKGDIKTGFQKLDKMGAIHVLDPFAVNEALIKDFMQATREKQSALIVSPTHAQIDSITEELRIHLKKEKFIGTKDVEVDRLKNRNLTVAEKNNWQNLQLGDVVQFNQNVPGIKRGSVWIIKQCAETGVKLQNAENKVVDLPLNRGNNFDVFEKTSLKIAKGDKIRITRGGFDKGSKRLDNGQTLTVISTHANGDIKLINPKSKVKYSLGRDFGHINHAYGQTSYSSQGKSADSVFIALPSITFTAANSKNLYVSVSRGRHTVRIYTDDKAQLLENVMNIGDRQSALELVQGKSNYIEMTRKAETEMRSLNKTMLQKQIRQESHIMTKNAKDYEPEL